MAHKKGVSSSKNGRDSASQRLGVKPGSPEFHRLKNGFVPTYDRWARPIELDDDLRHVYPNRGKSRPGSYRTAPVKGQSAKGKPAGHGAQPHDNKPAAKGAKSGAGQDKGTHRNQGNKGPDKGKGSNKVNVIGYGPTP